ncbi:MAG: hypothetical protein Kow00127_13950 [Bacteroidales bacterium]
MMIAVAALVIAALSLNSCSKEEKGGQTDVKTNKPHMSAEQESVFKSIVKFRDKIAYINEHPGYKSVENLSVDSAVWYLDATLNLSHAFISWEPMNNFYYDSVFVNITKSGDTVNLDDLALAYSELKQKVADVCIAAPGNEKELYIASLTINEESNNALTVKAYTIIGNKSTPPDNTPFDMGWMYGDLKGISSGPDPYDGMDACTELRDKTNEYRCLYVDDSQMLYISSTNDDPYVTIKSQNDIFINPDDPQPGDNYYERYLLYQEQGNIYHELIDKTEMNWYYHKLNYVIYNMVPNNQVEWPNAFGKTFYAVLTDNNSNLGTYGTKDYQWQIIRHQYKLCNIPQNQDHLLR